MSVNQIYSRDSLRMSSISNRPQQSVSSFQQGIQQVLRDVLMYIGNITHLIYPLQERFKCTTKR